MKKLFKKLTKNTSLAILAIIIIGAPLLYLTILNSKQASASWFNEDWLYRKSIPISAHTSEEKNVYISVTLDTSDTTRFQTDCGDLRFTRQNGELLPYFIVSGCGTSSTIVHIKLDSFPAGAQTFYYYYGNVTAANGFLTQDFPTVATNYTVGSLGSEEQSNGPVGYWKFDEGAGTIINDSSGSKNNGNLGIGTSAPSWQAEDQCIAGKCLYFNGGNTVSLGNPASLNPLKITLSGWIKATDFTTTRHLFGKPRGTPGSDGASFQLYIRNDGKPEMYARTTALGTITATSPDAITANQWYFITGTSDGTNLIIYVNGLEKKRTAFAANLEYSGTAPVTIGSYDNGATQFYLKGLMDDAKIYNFARTAAQIKQDYTAKSGASANQGSGTVMGAQNQSYLSDGLVGYWKTDEASGNATDSSGNSLTLTNNGTMAYGGGKFGNAATCNGSAAYLNTTTAVSGIKTVSFWVYPAAAANNYFINLINSSAYITINNTGVVSATGFTSPSIYVNGVLNGTVSAAVWSLITVASDTAVNADAFAVGLTNDGTNHFCTNTSRIDEIRLYNRALSSGEIRQLTDWAPGPIAYWNFEDASGTVANDTSGNGLSLTLGSGTIDMPTWTNGKYGKALSFNGTTNYLSAANNGLFKPPNDMTLETWVYLNQTASSLGHDIVLVRKAHSADPWQSYQWDITSADNKIEFSWNVDPTHTYGLSTKTALAANTWYHLAVIKKGNTMRAYLNGVDDINSTSTTIAGTLLDSDGTLNIGRADSSNTKNLNGLMDEAKLYNYARTQQQIVSDMNAGHPAVGSPVSSSVAYYKFDEGQGTNANNSGSGGSSMYGILTNMSSPATATSGWTQSGKFGKALIFNGTNNFVNINGSANALAAGDITVSLWFNPTTTFANGSSLQYLYALSDSGSSNDIVFYLNTDGTLNFCSYTAAFTCVTSTQSSWTGGTWYHVVGTLNSTPTLSLYVNGNLVKTKASLGRNSTPAAEADIGRWHNGNYFSGTIDEVKIYSSAIAASDVKTEYNRGSSMVLGALSDNSSYEKQAANQEYCVPGDTTSCVAPVGEWKFEEKSGLSAYDTSGNANTGTLSGGIIPVWTSGKNGRGLSFSGTSGRSYVDTGNGASTRVTGNITVEAWIKPGSGGDATQTIVHKDSGYSLIFRTADYFVSWADGSSWSFAAFGYNDVGLVPNIWQHIVVTKTGSAVRVYINGTERLNKTFGGSITTNTNNVIIGAYQDILGSTGLQNYFAGLMDNVRIYNYARSGSQVAWDYNKGGPVGWWKFDECQGTIAHDSSENKLNGTILTPGGGTQTAAGTCTTAGTAWGNGASGKRNASLNFDGTDDLVNVGDPLNGVLDFPTGFTLSAWIKTTSGAGLIVMGKDDNTAGRSYSIFITSRKQGCSWNGSSTLETSTFDVTTGVWRHVVCTYEYVTNGTSKVRIYRDGALDVSSNTATGPTPAVNALFQIGARTYVGAQNWFDGQIDDVKIYSYPMTATQVKMLYNEGAVRFGPSTGSP